MHLYEVLCAAVLLLAALGVGVVGLLGLVFWAAGSERTRRQLNESTNRWSHLAPGHGL